MNKAYPKKGTIISSKGLTSLYGAVWHDSLLLSYLQQLPKVKGEKTKYGVRKDLPTFEDLHKDLEKKHTYCIMDILSNAQNEVEALAQEMEEWKDSIPENLQGGDKYCAVEEAHDSLEQIDLEIDVPAELGKMTLVWIPNYKLGSSRSARVSDVINSLEGIRTFLADLEDNLEAAAVDSELDQLINDLEGVDFPTMFS